MRGDNHLGLLRAFLDMQTVQVDEARQYHTNPHWIMIDREHYIVECSPSFTCAMVRAGLWPKRQRATDNLANTAKPKMHLSRGRFAFPRQYKMAIEHIDLTFVDQVTRKYYIEYPRDFGTAKAGDISSHQTIYSAESDAVVLAWHTIDAVQPRVSIDELKR